MQVSGESTVTKFTTYAFATAPIAMPGSLACSYPHHMSMSCLLKHTRLHIPLGDPLFSTTTRVELLAVSTDESLEIWRRQGLFNKSISQRDVSLLRDQELRAACACTAGGVTYVAGGTETHEASMDRHRAMRIALEEHELKSACSRTGGAVVYVAPAADENSNVRLARRHRLERELKAAGSILFQHHDYHDHHHQHPSK